MRIEVIHLPDDARARAIWSDDECIAIIAAFWILIVNDGSEDPAVDATFFDYAESVVSGSAGGASDKRWEVRRCGFCG